MKKVTRILMIGLAFVLLGVIAARLFLLTHRSGYAGVEPIADYGTVKAFSLTDQNGNSFDSSSLKGSIWVADFIFTRCAGPCPLVTAKMTELQHAFPKSTGVKFVTISVDPEYDKPAVLKKYAASYRADESRWTFLTGTSKAIFEIIRDNFHLIVQPGSSETDIMHSLHHVLIDKQGRIIGYFNSADQTEVDQLKERLKKMV